METVRLLKGDCLQRLKELEDNSIDSVVTDPPYEIGFMGKSWDDSGIANNPELWKEVLRVLKPGGHLLSFSHSRTYHRQAVAVEDAGFEIRDQLMWVYGSGFPKSHNIGNKLGEEYKGIGTALKPAHEPIVMARKPFKGSVAENVLEWRTGGLNIDGCRIASDENDKYDIRTYDTYHKTFSSYAETNEEQTFSVNEKNDLGRFPANIIFDEEAGKILDKQSGNKTGQRGVVKGTEPSHTKKNAIYGDYSMVEGKFAKPMDDLGGASRFFYCPKASKKDKNEGCDGLPQKANVFMSPDSRMDKEHYERTSPGMERFKTEPKSNYHPTVKPTDLCAYLIRLVTPKGGTVLDPFMGSGSMGKAAVREGMNFIGIEREEEYMEISKSRIEYEQKKNKHREFFI